MMSGSPCRSRNGIEQRSRSDREPGDLEIHPIPESSFARHDTELGEADEKKSDSVESDSVFPDS